MEVTDLGNLGGILFLLAFLHFIVDWGLQSHWEAMNKASNWKVRARHCTVYTVGMSLGLFPFMGHYTLGVSLLILWVSHFLIDTYLPVYVWARYLRRPPEMVDEGKAAVRNEDTGNMKLAETELEKFKAFARTPIGLFLVIAMDQAWHLAFLVPIAAFLVFPFYGAGITYCTAVALTLLGGVVGLGYLRIKE